MVVCNIHVHCLVPIKPQNNRKERTLYSVVEFWEWVKIYFLILTWHKIVLNRTAYQDWTVKLPQQDW